MNRPVLKLLTNICKSTRGSFYTLCGVFLRIAIATWLTIIVPAVLHAQEIRYSSAQIRHDLERLRTAATVLYVAAHPDDENTRLISYLVNERHFRTAYLSLTRGEGGQNLIGSEHGPALGVIRSHVLHAARRIEMRSDRPARRAPPDE